MTYLLCRPIYTNYIVWEEAMNMEVHFIPAHPVAHENQAVKGAVPT